MKGIFFFLLLAGTFIRGYSEDVMIIWPGNDTLSLTDSTKITFEIDRINIGSEKRGLADRITFGIATSPSLETSAPVMPNRAKPVQINAAADRLVFSLTAPFEGAAVQIYNVDGRLVRSLRAEENDTRLIWDCTSSGGGRVVPGCYTIRCIRGESQTSFTTILK